MRYEHAYHVGYVYFLKLIHTAASKYSCRSIGDYNIKFSQPIRGRYVYSQNPLIGSGEAQKLGGMEVSTLMARDMPYFLHEAMCIKSDNHASRRIFIEEQLDFSKFFGSSGKALKISQIYLNGIGLDLKRIDPQDRSSPIMITLLPQDKVLQMSNGEVKLAETIHYKYKRGVPSGLFCPKIFGNDKDYACDCERYVGRRYKGFTCPSCGILIESKDSKRGMIGHVKLSSPVINLKIINVHIRRLFGLSSLNLNGLMNFKRYLIVDHKGDFSFAKD
ncbi:MAG: hypothetical protein GY771_03370 [bacterium]|nr:hypothetical protein [bacterium]